MDGSARSKVNLHLLARPNFDAPDSRRIGLAEPAHKALDRLIGAGELNLQLEILINPLRRQSLRDLLLNQLLMDSTDALSPDFPGGRDGGTLCSWLGWMKILANRPAVDFEVAGDASNRPAPRS